MPTTQENPAVVLVPIENLKANPNQPRKTFDQESLKRLAKSIKALGVIQPVIISPDGTIIAGERRYRAGKLAGLDEIPAIIKEITPREAAEMAVVENTQRDDLNPIEEAEAYKRYIDENDCTQKVAAKRFGIAESKLTELLNTLKLNPKAQELVTSGRLTFSHAKALFKGNRPVGHVYSYG